VEHNLTLDEIKTCIRAIARHPKGAIEVSRPPAEIYVLPDGDDQLVHINFVKPSDMSPGSIYRTWIVTLHAGKPTNTDYQRFERASTGDDKPLD